MAIEEEFSIEIPDKDADTIHSGKTLRYSYRKVSPLPRNADIPAVVDKAVEYIINQPDAH